MAALMIRNKLLRIQQRPHQIAQTFDDALGLLDMLPAVSRFGVASAPRQSSQVSRFDEFVDSARRLVASFSI